MVGCHYRPCLIKGGFSPTNLAMLYTTDAVNGLSVFCLEDEII